MREMLLCLTVASLLTTPGSAGADETEETPPSTGPEESAATPLEPVVVPGLWVWQRASVALAYAPLGLLATSRTQLRGPMGRSRSMIFQDTYAGVGGHFAISPAFAEVGPRFSLAPADMFDVDFTFTYTYTWRSSAGLLPYSGITGTLDNQRTAIKATAVAGSALTASVSPTFKIKVGPVIGLWNTEWAFIHHPIPTGVTSPYVYEALRDMVVAWDDMVVTNIAAVLVEVFDGTGPKDGPGPVLRVGAITRDKQTLVSRDISTALGGVVTFRPGPKPGWPDLLVAVMGYLRDEDRRFGAPNIQLQAAWVLERPLSKPQQVADDVKSALR
jgi:hypothetical protein